MARLKGTSSADHLKGTGRNDDISGSGGHDRIFGYGGNDDLEGGSGNDYLSGGAGHDDLEGDSGNDTLRGGDGNDELEGGSGRDLFVYASGRDTIEDFNANDDRIELDRALGIDSFSELMAKARLVDDGEDILFDFGNGNRLVIEDTSLNELTAAHFGLKSGGGTVTPPSVDDGTLTGTARNDHINGGSDHETIHGYAGNDDLNGGSGNDTIYGGAGNDDIEGDSGNDRLNGGSGRNELEGGRGADTFVFSTGFTEIEDFEMGVDDVVIGKALGVVSFAELIALADVVDGGDDVQFDFGGAVLRFDDTSLRELQSSDFTFV